VRTGITGVWPLVLLGFQVQDVGGSGETKAQGALFALWQTAPATGPGVTADFPVSDCPVISLTSVMLILLIRRSQTSPLGLSLTQLPWRMPKRRPQLLVKRTLVFSSSSPPTPAPPLNSPSRRNSFREIRPGRDLTQRQLDCMLHRDLAAHPDFMVEEEKTPRFRRTIWAKPQ
jgi:hypothetical protein